MSCRGAARLEEETNDDRKDKTVETLERLLEISSLLNSTLKLDELLARSCRRRPS